MTYQGGVAVSLVGERGDREERIRGDGGIGDAKSTSEGSLLEEMTLASRMRRK